MRCQGISLFSEALKTKSESTQEAKDEKGKGKTTGHAA